MLCPLEWTLGAQIIQRWLYGDFLRASSSTFLIHTSKTQDKHLNTCKGPNTSKARAWVASSCSITTSTIGLDFPGGPVVKSPPSNTGNSGSIPDQEIKIPHALRKLSPRATTREACVP